MKNKNYVDPNELFDNIDEIEDNEELEESDSYDDNDEMPIYWCDVCGEELDTAQEIRYMTCELCQDLSWIKE